MSITIPICLLSGLMLCFSACAEPPRAASSASAYEEDAMPESMPNFTLRWLFGVGMGRKLHVEHMQVYYVYPVTEEQAQATGNFLAQLGLGQRESLVQVRKNLDASPPVYELRLGTTFTRKEHIDHETRMIYQLMALAAEGAVFDGAPVQIHLCNRLLQPLLILRPRLKPPTQ